MPLHPHRTVDELRELQKLTEDDWDLIYRVHVLGAFRVTHAAWGHMRDASYGRIVFTESVQALIEQHHLPLRDIFVTLARRSREGTPATGTGAGMGTP